MSGARTCIIVPVFNEEKRLTDQLNYWQEVSTLDGVDFIFINDGSSDKTSNVLKSILNFRVIDLAINQGKSNAVRHGLNIAISENFPSVGFIDGDGAISVADLRKILSVSRYKFDEGFDSVWGSRVGLAGRNIVRSIRRHWIARFINTILGLRDGNLPYDTQCGLKIFRNSTKLECALNGNFRTRWFLDIEILLNSKICKNEIRIWEEPLTDWSDVKGSKLGGIKATVSILLEIIVILRRLGNIKRKIKLN